MTMPVIRSSVVLALSVLSTGVAVAQQAGASSDGLQEVVVTAERREESAQHAALAISTVSGDDILDANVTTAGGLTTVVPALQVADSIGPYSVFFLRGVGNFAGTGLTDPAVAMNFDGVTVTRSGTAGLFFDLARVEVLKGPQGTLYGRNATGGVINVISNAPMLNETGADASVEFGNYSALRADGMINLPLGDTAAVRAAAFHVQHNGYMNDGTDEQSDSAGRLSLLFKPSDMLNISLVADYYHQGGGEIVGTTVIGVNSAFVAPPPFRTSDRVGLFSPQMAAYLAVQPNALSGRTFAPFPDISRENNTYWGVSSTIDWTTPVGTLTLIPAYRHSQSDYTTLASGIMIRELSTETENSFEARLTSDTQRALRYIVGVYYLHDPLDEPRFDVSQQSNFSWQSYKVGTDSRAAFASLTYAVTSAVRLTGGVRYTQDDKDFTGAQTNNTIICKAGFLQCPNAPIVPYLQLSPGPPNFNPFAPGAGGTITVASPITNGPESASYSKVTWRGALETDLTDQNLLYASVETGYRSGGFFFSADANTFKPETIRAYTVGSKNRFLDNKLQANFEAYYYRYHDQQIAHLATDSKFNNIFPTDNVGTATYKGAELDLQARPARNTLLSADVQYEDGVYDSFRYQTPNQNNGLGNGTGCPNGVPPGTTYTIDCSGYQPPMTPRWTLSGGVQQTIPLAGGNLVAGARGRYQSSAYTGRAFLPTELQNGYAIWDFELTYTTASDHFYAGAYVHNAFDKVVNNFSFNPPFSQIETGLLLPPRTYGVRLGVHY